MNYLLIYPKEVYSYNRIALQHVSSQTLLSVNGICNNIKCVIIIIISLYLHSVRPDLQHRFSSQQDPLSQWFTVS